MTKEQLRPYKNREVRMLLCSCTHGNEWVEGTLVCETRGEGRGDNFFNSNSYYLLHNTERWRGGNLCDDRRQDYRYDWAVEDDFSSDIMSHGIKPIQYIIKHRMTQ